MEGSIHIIYQLHVIIVSTFMIAAIIFSIFLIFTILGPGKIPKAIRIVLINILIGVIAFAIVGLAAAVLNLHRSLYTSSISIYDAHKHKCILESSKKL